MSSKSSNRHSERKNEETSVKQGFQYGAMLFMLLSASLLLLDAGCKKRGDTSNSSTPATTPTTPGATADLPPAKKPDGKPFRLAFVTNNTSDFWKIAVAGVRKYEAEGKVQV